MDKLIAGAHKTGSGHITNGGFVNLDYTYDITWHYDPSTDEVVVTNTDITLTRGTPEIGGTGISTGFWDTITFVKPGTSLPHETGGPVLGDLPGVNGDSLYNLAMSTGGLLAFFSQNNKTENYVIRYNNDVPYRVSKTSGRTYTILQSENRYNSYNDDVHIVPAWICGSVTVTVTLPTPPTRQTTSTTFHYLVLVISG